MSLYAPHPPPRPRLPLAPRTRTRVPWLCPERPRARALASPSPRVHRACCARVYSACLSSVVAGQPLLVLGKVSRRSLLVCFGLLVLVCCRSRSLVPQLKCAAPS